MNMNNITEKIHTINPAFSEELLDLLYEYIFTKYSNNLQKNTDSNDIQTLLNFIMSPLQAKDKS